MPRDAAQEADGQEAEPDRAPGGADGRVAALEVRVDAGPGDQLGQLEDPQRERIERDDSGARKRDQAVPRLPGAGRPEQPVEGDLLAPGERLPLGRRRVPRTEAEDDRRQGDRDQARHAAAGVRGREDEVAGRRFQKEGVAERSQEVEGRSDLKPGLPHGEGEHGEEGRGGGEGERQPGVEEEEEEGDAGDRQRERPEERREPAQARRPEDRGREGHVGQREQDESPAEHVDPVPRALGELGHRDRAEDRAREDHAGGLGPQQRPAKPVQPLILAAGEQRARTDEEEGERPAAGPERRVVVQSGLEDRDRDEADPADGEIEAAKTSAGLRERESREGPEGADRNLAALEPGADLAVGEPDEELQKPERGRVQKQCAREPDESRPPGREGVRDG